MNRSPVTRAILLDAQARGLHIRGLARELGVPPSTVWSAQQREGVALVKGRRGPTGADEDAAERAEAAGMAGLSDAGLLAYARALDAGQRVLGARFDALMVMAREQRA